ncbi:Uu.00g028490.m01.CDS01 [Anthostomella pinea]|uniref:Uu.00g028490.m01.CDS01 n=1 Tax=Anthostomella pinea TaxID=933095 RepID=A0AAI8YCQ1_9PEZI|nr:Uu.00g028490.m01.CDS01 [Anthostomella pinea]
MHFTTATISLLALAGASIATPLAKVEKRFNGGWCGLHLHVSSGDNDMEDVTAKVFDGNGILIAAPAKVHSDEGTVTVDIQEGGMPANLHIIVTQDKQDDNVASFTYGDQGWTSGNAKNPNSRCKVGDWDLASTFDEHETVDLDCGFSC